MFHFPIYQCVHFNASRFCFRSAWRKWHNLIDGLHSKIRAVNRVMNLLPGKVWPAAPHRALRDWKVRLLRWLDWGRRTYIYTFTYRPKFAFFFFQGIAQGVKHEQESIPGIHQRQCGKFGKMVHSHFFFRHKLFAFPFPGRTLSIEHFRRSTRPPFQLCPFAPFTTNGARTKMI